jgi:hypothetical protein
MQTTENRSGTRLALFLFAILGVFGVGALFINVNPPAPVQPPAPAAQPAAAPTPAPEPHPWTLMSTDVHVAEAKKALGEWKPHKDPMKTQWGRVTDAEAHLKWIADEHQRRPDVAKLQREVDRRKKEIDRLSKIATREVFAKQLEKTYLDKGLDVYVSLEGSDKTTLKLKFVPFSRPLVHQFSNDTNAIAALRQAGFKKVRLTDGYDQAWTLDL